MPGLLLTESAEVRCAHSGTAAPVSGNPKVLLGGQRCVLHGVPHLVSACPLPPPPGANGPCVVGYWQTATTRVTSFGIPLAIQESPGTCLPTGAPMIVLSTQTRVIAT